MAAPTVFSKLRRLMDFIRDTLRRLSCTWLSAFFKHCCLTSVSYGQLRWQVSSGFNSWHGCRTEIFACLGRRILSCALLALLDAVFQSRSRSRLKVNDRQRLFDKRTNRQPRNPIGFDQHAPVVICVARHCQFHLALQKNRPGRIQPRPARVNSWSSIAPAQCISTRKNLDAFVGLTWKGDTAPVTGTHGPAAKLVVLKRVP